MKTATLQLFKLDQIIQLPSSWESQESRPVLTTFNDVSSSPVLAWGVKCMNLLLERLFSDLFPNLKVECGLIKAQQPNAHMFGFRDRGKLFVTTAALERIHDAGRKIHKAPFFQSASDGGLAVESKLIDEELTFLALASLLGHELGHLHDQQFYPRRTSLVRPEQIETQALEFSADTWGLRACTELILAPVIAANLDGAQKIDAILRGVTRALIGHGVLERLDWDQPWVTPRNGWHHDHPPSTWRLFAGAVAIAEWLQEQGSLSGDTATRICAASFDTAARALHWYTRGEVREPWYFLKTSLELHDQGAPIDLWRKAYESFQKDLQPRGA